MGGTWGVWAHIGSPPHDRCVCPPFPPPQVVRSAATSGAGSTTSGVVSGSLGSREVNYILRVLGPAACRSPHVFTEVATGCIRIALPAPRGSGTGGGWS